MLRESVRQTWETIRSARYDEQSFKNFRNSSESDAGPEIIPAKSVSQVFKPAPK